MDREITGVKTYTEVNSDNKWFPVLYLLEMWKCDKVVDEQSKENEDRSNDVEYSSPAWSLQA